MWNLFLCQSLLRNFLHLQVEEYESTESQWKNLPIAHRQRELLKKWKTQLKVMQIKLSVAYVNTVYFIN